MDKKQLYRYTGNPQQLYSVRRVTVQEGRARGTTVIEAYTAGGLQVDILPDMGMDIGQVRYKGVNMSYISKNGYDSPAVFLPYETEFLHSFPGGMLYTCGLRSVGPAHRDGDEWQPIHGRVHSLQAMEICAGVRDDCLVVSGVLWESALFGHLLRMRRQITLPVYGSQILIEDEIENLTSHDEEFMLLYHFNFGYPLLSEKAKLVLPENRKTTPRTEFARNGMDKALSFESPVDGEEERVFFHEMVECWARLENEEVGASATLRWNGDSLPVLAQWRSMASGDYVLGLEPANCYILGRAAERENGTMKTLGGFERITTKLILDFMTI